MSLRSRLKWWATALAGCAAFLLAPTGKPAQGQAAGDSVTVAPGLSPRMRPSAVAQTVLDQLSRPIHAVTVDPSTGQTVAVPPVPTILSMSAVSGADLPKVDPHLSPDPYPLLWVVRASGAFVAGFGPPGAPPIQGGAGYYLIDDATGNIVGMGIDRPPGSP